MRIRPLFLFLLVAACREPESPPTEFETHCMELVRDVLPDVHAVLGESVGRQVRVEEVARSGAYASVNDANGVIRVYRKALDRRWRAARFASREAKDRDLTLILAHELAHVYQMERRRWMLASRKTWLEDDWLLSQVPSEGHASWVSNEVARRRGWAPLFGMGWGEESLASQLRERALENRWLLREMRAGSAFGLDPYVHGAAYVGGLVRRRGHDGALREMRRSPPRVDSDVMWPDADESEDAAVRDALRRLFAPAWGEARIRRGSSRGVAELLLAESDATVGKRGWRIETRELHDALASAEMLLFPTPDARRLIPLARAALESLADSSDVFGLRVSSTATRLQAEVLVGQDPHWRTEVWLADGDWLAVLRAEELVAGPEWAEAWMRNALRVVRGDRDAGLRATGWVARWQELWDKVAPLAEVERGKELFKHLDDESTYLRALAWAHLPWDRIPEDEHEDFCRRLREQKAWRVRMGARRHLGDLFGEPMGEGTEARALMESLLLDADPFIRSGAFHEWYEPGGAASWTWYWRFALTDPQPWLRADAVFRLTLERGGEIDEAFRLAEDVPGRGTVEQAVAALLDDEWHREYALRLLVRHGSREPGLWDRLLRELRGEAAARDYGEDAVELLRTCPVPGGDRRAALEALAGEGSEPLRRWARLALSLQDE